MMQTSLFIVLTGFWGLSYVAIKIMVETSQPIYGAMFRVVFSLLVLTVCYWLLKKPMKVPREVQWKVWLAGLFLIGIPFPLLFWAEQFVSPGLTAILVATLPLWTFGSNLIFLPEDEPFSRQKLMGIIVGFMGVCIIFTPQLTHTGSRGSLWGIVGILIVSIFYTAGTLMNRYLMSHQVKIDRNASLYQQHVSSLLFLALVAFFMEGKPQTALFFSPGRVLGALCYLSIFSTALAWMIFLYLLEQWGTLRVSLINYLTPLVTLIADFLLFGNMLSFWEIVGGGSILSGIIIIRFPLRRVTSPALQAQ